MLKPIPVRKVSKPETLLAETRAWWRYYAPSQLTIMGTQTRCLLDFLEYISGSDYRTLRVLQDAGYVEFQDNVGQFQVVRLFEL